MYMCVCVCVCVCVNVGPMAKRCQSNWESDVYNYV